MVLIFLLIADGGGMESGFIASTTRVGFHCLHDFNIFLAFLLTFRKDC